MDAVSLQVPALDDSFDLPAIPLRVLSRDGFMVETSTALWSLCPSTEPGVKYCINWTLLDQIGNNPQLTPRAQYLLKLYLADRLSKRSVGTVHVNYRSFMRFARWLACHANGLLALSNRGRFNWSNLGEGLARAFLDWSVKHTAEKGIDFCCLRTFYGWGVAHGYPDFHRDTLHLLRSIKATGNTKGHHVRFRHPIKGPFSPDELFLIRKALQAEQGTDQDRAIVMLHLELGLNPYASRQIINADFKRYKTDQVITYQIDVPRIKKRTTHRETKRRPISRNLGQLLERLQQGDADAPLLHWLASSRPEYAIIRAMRRFAKAADLISPQTNTLLAMTPRRFRTALATHMAAQGASRFHIAEVLDHTDLQNVDVYTQTAPSIADPVAAATDSSLQPLVKRFLGKVTNSTEVDIPPETALPHIPALAPHIPLPLLNTGGIGLCGKNVQKEGLCRLLPPLSCYLCPSFIAFRDAPHKEMLSSLKTFLQQGREMADDRIMQQLDDVCLAISEVLTQLDSNRQKTSDAMENEQEELNE